MEAENGADALEKLSGIDLILTDWNMPIMNGLDFVKAVRASTAYAKLPIIMVTTEGAKESVIEALKNGVNDYVVKPFNKITIVEKIESLIKS